MDQPDQDVRQFECFLLRKLHRIAMPGYRFQMNSSIYPNSYLAI